MKCEDWREKQNNPKKKLCYLDRFCRKLQKDELKNENVIIKVNDLHKLICHLSNLELKPLRKYFNNKGHKTVDYWDESRLAEKFENWILREWRVNFQKDKKKAEGKVGDYKKLKCKWAELGLKDNLSQKNKKRWRTLKDQWATKHKGKLIDFWLKTDPFYTIPPYQDSNNRRPPKCQSLILNTEYLNRYYSKWKDWLDSLKKIESVWNYLDNYEDHLKNLRSSGKTKVISSSGHKNNKFSYFCDNDNHEDKSKRKYQRSPEHLQARVFQFIFDRLKDNDPLKLNDIYSHAKKYRQHQSTERDKEEAKDNLEKAIRESKLPLVLTTKRDYKNEAVFAEGSFLHLICKYYKWRQRAKDGRIFIHPKYRYVKGRGYENTGRFDDKSCLLTYCNYQPRQKRYQMLGDLAGLLQISPQKLKEFVEKNNSPSNEKENKLQTIDEKIFHWLDNISSFKTNCDKAAKEQKSRRGRLKLDIQKIYKLLSDKEKKKTINQILKKSKTVDAPKFYRFCERAKELCLQVTNDLYNESSLYKNPSAAVYFLAQINNIVFKERNGNAKTCAVCSTDNAQRMQKLENEDIRAKAQRLPAISTRIIDGAVMRMARIVGNAIAEDKWKTIKTELEKGNKVCIPIITESNYFEFEPNLKTLKGKSLKNKDKDYQSSNPLEDKKKRIKENSQGRCPYTDEALGDEGDIDHIIPRSVGCGVLNDEANLMWTSEKGNKEVKKDKIFSLTNLKPNYKGKQFGPLNDTEITNWIVEQIGNGKEEDFKFGKYRSFINLSPSEQKAFRHALFLVGHPLREKVIKAIDNRTRTLVNGTQRYFAQNLADNLYKKAKNIGKKNLLSFDYFGIEAWDNTRGNGIKDLRKELVENYCEDLEKFNKLDDESSQEPYSHLLDAQIAFCMAVCEHQKEGSFKLKLQENGLGLWSRKVDRETSNKIDKDSKIYDASLFDAMKVSESEYESQKLNRRKPYTVETHHRQLVKKGEKISNSVSYQIHRDGMIAERFFSLFEYSNGQIKKGFTNKNSVPLVFKKGTFKYLKPFMKKIDEKKPGYNIWIIDKRKAQKFLMEVGLKGTNAKENNIAKILDQLSYQTVKKEIFFCFNF